MSGASAGDRIEIGIVFHPASHSRLNALRGNGVDPLVSRNIPVPPNTPIAKVFRAFSRDQNLPQPDDWRLIYLPYNHPSPAADCIITVLTVKIGTLGVKQNDQFAVIHKDDATRFKHFPPARQQQPSTSTSTPSSDPPPPYSALGSSHPLPSAAPAPSQLPAPQRQAQAQPQPQAPPTRPTQQAQPRTTAVNGATPSTVPASSASAPPVTRPVQNRVQSQQQAPPPPPPPMPAQAEDDDDIQEIPAPSNVPATSAQPPAQAQPALISSAPTQAQGATIHNAPSAPSSTPVPQQQPTQDAHVEPSTRAQQESIDGAEFVPLPSGAGAGQGSAHEDQAQQVETQDVPAPTGVGENTAQAVNEGAAVVVEEPAPPQPQPAAPTEEAVAAPAPSNAQTDQTSTNTAEQAPETETANGSAPVGAQQETGVVEEEQQQQPEDVSMQDVQQQEIATSAAAAADDTQVPALGSSSESNSTAAVIATVTATTPVDGAPEAVPSALEGDGDALMADARQQEQAEGTAADPIAENPDTPVEAPSQPQPAELSSTAQMIEMEEKVDDAVHAGERVALPSSSASTTGPATAPVPVPAPAPAQAPPPSMTAPPSQPAPPLQTPATVPVPVVAPPATTAAPTAPDDVIDDMFQSMWDSGTGSESWQHAMAGFGASAPSPPPDVSAPVSGTAEPGLSAGPGQGQGGEDAMMTDAPAPAPVPTEESAGSSGGGGSVEKEGGAKAAQQQQGPRSSPKKITVPVGSTAGLNAPAPSTSTSASTTAPKGVSTSSSSSSLPSNGQAAATATAAVSAAAVPVAMTLGGEGVDLMRNILAAATQETRARPGNGFNLPRFIKKPSASGSAVINRLAHAAGAGVGTSRREETSTTVPAAQDAHATPNSSRGNVAASAGPTQQQQQQRPISIHSQRPSAQTARDFFAEELLESSPSNRNDQTMRSGDVSMSSPLSRAAPIPAPGPASSTPVAATAFAPPHATETPSVSVGASQQQQQRTMLPPPKKAGPGPASKMAGFRPRPKSRGGDGSLGSGSKKDVLSSSVIGGENGADVGLGLCAVTQDGRVLLPREQAPPVLLPPALQERQMDLIRVKQEQMAEAARDEMLLMQGMHDDGGHGPHPHDEPMRERDFDGPAPPNGSQARLLHDPKDLLPRRAPSRSQTPPEEDPRDVKAGNGKQYKNPRRWWEGEDELGRRSRSPIEPRKHPLEVRKQMTKSQRELNELVDGPIDRLPEEGPRTRPRPKYTQDWSSGSGEDTDEGDSADEATLRRREEMLAAKGIGATLQKTKRRRRRRRVVEGGEGEAGAAEGSGSATAAAAAGGRGGSSARASQVREKSLRESAEAPVRVSKVEAFAASGLGLGPAVTAPITAAIATVPAVTAAAAPAASKAGPASKKDKGKATALLENAEQAEAKAAEEIEGIINRHEYLKLHPVEGRRVRSGERKALYDECPRIPKELIDWREQYALNTAEELDQLISDLLGGNLWHDDKINDRFHFKAVTSKTKLARMLVLLEICLLTRASLASQLRNRGKGGGRKNIGVAPGSWPITVEHVLDKTMKFRRHLELTTRDLDDALADAVALKRRDFLDGEPDKELEEKLAAASSSQIRVVPPTATTLQQPPTPPGFWEEKRKKRAAEAAQRAGSATGHRAGSASGSRRAGTHDSRSNSPSTSLIRNRLPAAAAAKAKAADSSGSGSVGGVLNHNAELKRKRALQEADEDSEKASGGEEEGEQQGVEDTRPLARIKTVGGGAAAAPKKAATSKGGSRRPSGNTTSGAGAGAGAGASSPVNGFMALNASPGPSRLPASRSFNAATSHLSEESFDTKFASAFSSAFEQRFPEALGKAWRPLHEVGFNELFPKAAHEYWQARQKELESSLRRQISADLHASFGEHIEDLQRKNEELENKFQAALETFQAEQERKQLARERYHRRVMKEEMLVELGKELRAQLQGRSAGAGAGSSITSTAEAENHGEAPVEKGQGPLGEEESAGPSNGPKRRKIKKSAPSAAKNKLAGEAAASSSAEPTTPSASRAHAFQTQTATDEPRPASSSATPFRSPGGDSGDRLEIILPLRPRSMNDVVVQQSSEDEAQEAEGAYAAAEGGAPYRREEEYEMESDAALVEAAMGSQGGGGRCGYRGGGRANVERLRGAASALVDAMEGSDDVMDVAVDHALERTFGGPGGAGEEEDEGEEEEEGQAYSPEMPRDAREGSEAF